MPWISTTSCRMVSLLISWIARRFDRGLSTWAKTEGTPGDMLKLLIADDNRDVAEVVAFGARMVWPDCRVTLAGSGREALRCFDQESPDLVVLDVSMPPPDGFDVCRRVRATSQAPILMLSVRDGTLDKVRALDLGADDYLTKPFDDLELLARLRALARRVGRLDQPVPSRPAMTTRATELRTAAAPGLPLSAQSLSTRERAVLRMVAEGCSNRQIAEALIIGERTVKFHVTSAFNKLGADNRAHAAALAIRHGLM